MKLSPTQAAILADLRDLAPVNAARLVRLPGGFWTYPGCPYKDGRPDTPRWYALTPTVRALTRLGVLARAHRYPEEWRDDRILVQRLPLASAAGLAPPTVGDEILRQHGAL